MSLQHDLIHDALSRGVAAAKAHSVEEARYYLHWVLRQKPAYEDRTQALLWLSEVADNDDQRRSYLEDILSYDPAHPTARRGLAILQGRLRADQIIDPETPAAPAPSAPEPVKARRFICPQCGGAMAFDPQQQKLICRYCNFAQTELDALGQPSTKPGDDFVVAMAKGEGRRWRHAGYLIRCQGCGATTILPAGQISAQCPFCDSAQVVPIENQADIIEPAGIIPFRLSEVEAQERFRAWLGAGWLRPAGLQRQAQSDHPRAVYVPYWAFEFIGEVHWNALVAEGHGRYRSWAPRHDYLTVLQDRALVPASHTLPAGPLRALDEFDLSELQPFSEEKIAAWPAEIYQISMSDASIVAREQIAKRLRRKIDAEVLGNASYKDLTVSTQRLSVDRFQHLLLPVWVFSYHYKEKVYHVLVNGQTGETEGETPKDGAFAGFVVALGLCALIAVIILLALLLR